MLADVKAEVAKYDAEAAAEAKRADAWVLRLHKVFNSKAANRFLPRITKGARREVQGLHERVLARTPAARWGDPKDFAGIAVFLSSAASDFVTGTAIPVDGGFSVQG